MKSWEEEESWIVDWLEVQDRLGLGPEQGDIVMADIEPVRDSSMMEEDIMMEEEWIERDKEYMDWLERDLREMDVLDTIINMVVEEASMEKLTKPGRVVDDVKDVSSMKEMMVTQCLEDVIKQFLDTDELITSQHVPNHGKVTQQM